MWHKCLGKFKFSPVVLGAHIANREDTIPLSTSSSRCLRRTCAKVPAQDAALARTIGSEFFFKMSQIPCIAAGSCSFSSCINGPFDKTAFSTFSIAAFKSPGTRCPRTRRSLRLMVIVQKQGRWSLSGFLKKSIFLTNFHVSNSFYTSLRRLKVQCKK